MERPDLQGIDPKIVAYIEHLEHLLRAQEKTFNSDEAAMARDERPPLNWVEPETTQSVLTLCIDGTVKRTYRHLFARQHRGGMGIFDIEVPPTVSPTDLILADESQVLLVFTNKARVFRTRVRDFDPVPVRSKGESIFGRLALDSSETVITALPEQATGYVALLGENGKVRCLRHHLFGEHLKPGTELFKLADFGQLVDACWTPGDEELFIATELGMGIRFAEKSLSPQGDLGIRLASGDRVVAVTSVDEDSGVFLLGADGKGTIRSMAGFAPNKAPGGGGKMAIKNQKVVAAFAVNPQDDILAITRQAKIIRFQADEVPATEGVVQGVNCIGIRTDAVVAASRIKFG